MIDLKNKRVVIMGLGLHGGGVGVAQWLAARGANLLITDLRNGEILKNSLNKLKKTNNFELVLGRHREKDFITADLIIKNPGVQKNSKYLKIARKHKIPVETDVSLFFSMCKAPIIGVTGTKGKSTTTMLIYMILKQAKLNPLLAGNIRISPLSILSKVKKETPVVMELSSWQLEDMIHLKKSPHISVITNILADHLNRYKGIKEYSEAKKNIYKFQRPGDSVVLNFNNKIIRNFKDIRSKKYWISSSIIPNKDGCYIKNGWIIYKKAGTKNIIIPVKDIKLPGIHNLENIMSAIAVSKIYGVSNAVIREVIKRFKGMADRLELIRQWKGIKFYNDTTATAPDATMAALNCFSQQIVLIAGGSDKELNYKKLVKLIKKKLIFTILFKGSATGKIVLQLKNEAYKNFIIVNSMAQAVKSAMRYKSEAKIILLSPGAASFGIFLNEFDRGEQFKKEVRKIK